MIGKLQLMIGKFRVLSVPVRRLCCEHPAPASMSRATNGLFCYVGIDRTSDRGCGVEG